MSSLLSGTRLHYTSFSVPGDELQTWSKEELEAMNARFVAALERAFECGAESRESAADQVKLPASSGPRWATPLCPEVSNGLLRSAMSGGMVFVARG